MSICTRCGAEFACAMSAGASAPCWCMALPPALKVPLDAVGCWCPACLRAQIAAQVVAGASGANYSEPPS